MDDKEFLEALTTATSLIDAPIDQSLLALTRCYGNTDMPRQVVETVYPGRSADWYALAFGAAARRGILLKAVEAALLSQANTAPKPLSTPTATLEFVWFLFSRKLWADLATLVDHLSNAERDALPGHVADLYFLAFYRLQGERLADGTDREGFLGDAEVTLHTLRQRWPMAQDRLAAFTACLAHVLGDFKGARRAFSALAPTSPFIEPLGGMDNVLPEEKFRNSAMSSAHLQMRPARADHVTLVSLDRSYFEKYAKLAAERYQESNPGNALHFHCVGFDPAEAIASWQLPATIGYTADNRDLTSLNDRQQRGYYASARYLYLPSYLGAYRSVFVADVDGKMLKNVAELAREHADDDAILRTKVLDPSRALTKLPWEAMSAGAFMVRATPGGMELAQRLSSYHAEALRRAEQDGKTLWYADQNSLFYCWCDLRQSVRFATFSKAPFSQRGAWQVFGGESERLAFLASSDRKSLR